MREPVKLARLARPAPMGHPAAGGARQAPQRVEGFLSPAAQ
jgi:hypothetical protein